MVIIIMCFLFYRPNMRRTFEASLPQTTCYGKKQYPQGNHLHQRQGGGGLRQADSFRDEQARQRAEPHGHRGSIPKSV